MRAVDVIQAKRDGRELTRDEIAFFIDGFAKGRIPEYQASAFTMAVFFRGMTAAETVALTDTMMRTGEVLGGRSHFFLMRSSSAHRSRFFFVGAGGGASTGGADGGGGMPARTCSNSFFVSTVFRERLGGTSAWR